MLYLVATPIGNLSDITLRALDVLRACDYVLCEDTRHSRLLLNHFDIQKPLKSHHKFNEASSCQEIISDLKDGKNIALVSDAGTPGISDPGHLLVKQCRQANVAVTALPGACAAITALTLSGLPTQRFQFVGFLPKKEQELRLLLIELLHYPGVSICYEGPHRLCDTLKALGTYQVTVARELTKLYEECLTAPAQELLEHFNTNPPRGEIVLLIEGSPKFHSPLSPQEHVAQLQKDFCLSLNESIKLVAHLRNISKRDLYKEIHC